MSQWPHDDARSRAAFYGDPATGEPGRQLVQVVPPFQMYYDKKPIAHVMFHRKAAAALAAVFKEIWEVCGHDQAKVDRSGASDFCGSYNHRLIRGSSSTWSNHAYGAAIDLNAEANGLGNEHGTMPAFVVAAFERQGFRWGGRYHGRKDFMHFEAVDNGLSNPPSPRIPVPEPRPIDPPMTDNESDAQVDAEVDAEDAKETEVAKPTHDDKKIVVIEEEKKKSFWEKAQNWILGGGGAVVATGSSWFSGIPPITIAIILGFGLVVFCIIWFTKKGNGW